MPIFKGGHLVQGCVFHVHNPPESTGSVYLSLIHSPIAAAQQVLVKGSRTQVPNWNIESKPTLQGAVYVSPTGQESSCSVAPCPVQQEADTLRPLPQPSAHLNLFVYFLSMLV